MRALAVFALVVLLYPWVAHTSYLITVATFTGIYTIVAVGLGLLMGYAGQVSLGQAAFYGVGAYTTAVLTTRYGLNPWLGVVAAMAVPALIAYVFGRTLSRLKGYYLAMATLAFGIAIYVVINEWADVTGGASGLYGIPKLSIAGWAISSGLPYYYFVWAIALLVIFMGLNIVRFRVGRALRSIHSSEVAAAAMGVDTGAYKMQVFILSAVLAGLAGALYAHMSYSLVPEPFGLQTSILFVTMVVLGGMRSIWGAVVGAMIVSAIRVGVNWLGHTLPGVTSEVELVLFGLILIGIVIFLPNSLVPTLAPLLRRIGRRPVKSAVEDGKGEAACKATSSA